MKYIFFVNDIDYLENFVSAEEIVKYLTKEKKWVFQRTAANIKKIKAGDNVLIYLCGKGRGYFVGSFVIRNTPTFLNSVSFPWLEIFPLKVDLEKIDIWPRKIEIKEVLNELDFIKDKKNYGLYFRQGSRVITEEDYINILKHVKNI